MTNLFVTQPAAKVAASTGLPVAWVQLYTDYLLYVAKMYGGTAFQDMVLGGPLLSDSAGGFIVKRSIHDWLYGAIRFSALQCARTKCEYAMVQCCALCPPCAHQHVIEQVYL